MKNFIFLLLTILITPCLSSASVTLLDSNDWKVLTSGFVEFDSITDTTRSLTEVIGSTPIDRSGTANQADGRTQFSIRNSRLAFDIIAPVEDDWKTDGYMEYDLLGYDPSTTSTAGNTESSFFTNPSLRVRHVYIKAIKDNWQFLVGQSWSLFGWQPQFVTPTVTVAPVTGILYQRTPEIIALHTCDMGSSDTLQLGASIERPTQRDSQIPNINAGAKLDVGQRKAAYATTTGDVKASAMSVGASGTLRQFETPNNDNIVGDTTKYMGAAYAIDAMIPIIASENDDDLGNTLTLTGEFTSGQGDGDEFPSWTGNQASPLSSGKTAPTNQVNLDAGLGDYDSNGNFQLLRMQSFNVNLQYQMPQSWHTFMNAAYTQLYSNNIASLENPVTGLNSNGKIPYEKSEAALLNLYHDFTKHVRGAVEAGNFKTTYSDGSVVADNRFQLSAWFRF